MPNYSSAGIKMVFQLIIFFLYFWVKKVTFFIIYQNIISELKLKPILN